MITVPLHIVDADSTPITKQQIHQHVAYLNSVYNPQGVAFTFDDQVDYVSKAADPDWINQKNNVIEKYAYGLHGKLLLAQSGKTSPTHGRRARRLIPGGVASRTCSKSG